MWEVSWRRRETGTYWPQVPLTTAALLTPSAGLLNRVSLRGQALCLELVLTPRASYLQLELQLELNWPKPSVAPGYIIVWRPPASWGRTHLRRIQPRPQVKVIFRYLRPDAPVSAVPQLIYTGAFLNWRLGRGSICSKISINLFLFYKKRSCVATVKKNIQLCSPFLIRLRTFPTTLVCNLFFLFRLIAYKPSWVI